jgi:hypothetical protein
MNGLNEPATEEQLRYLDHAGHPQTHPLTRSDAATLIRQLREHSAAVGISNGPGAGHYYLGLGNAGGKVVRQEFWLDTCREATQRHQAFPEVLQLYQLHGCRFMTPTEEKVQEVLEALDKVLPAWEQQHPELFFQTLELNFPELMRHC